jgi:acetyl-CoA C-acetyltransferase
MREAVIVSTVRTPIAKAFRGAFNATHPVTLGAHVIQQAVTRAGISAEEVEDVILGCGMPEAATGLGSTSRAPRELPPGFPSPPAGW